MRTVALGSAGALGTAVAFLAAVALIALACSPTGGASSPQTPPELTLRAWTTQALPPPASFVTGPLLSIQDGVAVGSGAVPAIYPGPLVAPLVARSISGAGTETIVRELAAAGLLGDRTDFTEGLMPGGVTGHVFVSYDGSSREIMGDISRTIQCITTPCVPAAGSAEAFATMWARLTDLPGWLGSELGDEQRYEPTAGAILVREAIIDPAVPGNVVAWPLDVALDAAGVPYPNVAAGRCLVVTEEELATVRPVFEQATQLTRFRDETGVERGLIVRWLMPGEPDPCSF